MDDDGLFGIQKWITLDSSTFCTLNNKTWYYFFQKMASQNWIKSKEDMEITKYLEGSHCRAKELINTIKHSNNSASTKLQMFVFCGLQLMY